MTGRRRKKKSRSCLLSVTEGDVKLILINVEGRAKVKLGPVVLFGSACINDVGALRKNKAKQIK